jgi:hypothetical protein
MQRKSQWQIYQYKNCSTDQMSDDRMSDYYRKEMLPRPRLNKGLFISSHFSRTIYEAGWFQCAEISHEMDYWIITNCKWKVVQA